MKKLLLTSLILFLFLPNIVSAQTEVDSVETVPVRNQNGIAPVGRGSISEEVKQTQETSQQNRNIRIRELFARLVRRFNMAVERLELMGNRINTRLTILSNRGVEVSALQEDLVQSQQILDSTKIQIQSLNADFEAALVAQNPKIAFETVRQKVTTIKTDLTTVLKTYAQIVRQMKGLSVQNNNTATQSAVTQ